jgi:hypothetical protein
VADLSAAGDGAQASCWGSQCGGEGRLS